MGRDTRLRVLWTLWMAGGGIATAVIVNVLTGSRGWAIVGLSGVDGHAAGQGREREATPATGKLGVAVTI